MPRAGEDPAQDEEGVGEGFGAEENPGERYEEEYAGLLKPSVIKPVFTTIEKNLVIKNLGRLHEEDRQALKKALETILG